MQRIRLNGPKHRVKRKPRWHDGPLATSRLGASSHRGSGMAGYCEVGRREQQPLTSGRPTPVRHLGEGG